MNTLPVDASMALSEANQNELVQRKLSMDALRERLGDPRTKQEKLRETCEGFEAIFLQKMWEQMRKTVSKEGYLHSKDEETYQSLFDVELSKKMSSAGGIGLADMLYEQLSQQLERTATTTAGSYRQPLDMPPVNGAAMGPVQDEAPLENKKLTEKDLYSPLEDEEDGEKRDGQEEDAVLEALAAMKAEMEAAVPESETGAAIRAEIIADAYPQAEQQPDQKSAPSEAAVLAGTAVLPETQGQQWNNTAAQQNGAEEKSSGFRGTSWQGAGIVSAAPKPVSAFKHNGMGGVEESAAAPRRSRGMVPEETLWPYEGKIVSGFGWEDSPGGGKRWNSGVTLEGAPGGPVQAVLDGTVIFSGQREGYGHTIILEHQDGFLSYYGNVDANSLAVGDKIQRGTNFANISAKPSSGQPEENFAPLFFELKRGEMALNPEAAIRRLTVAER